MIRRGDSGSEVKDLQERLVRLGFGPLEVDGQFGPATASALRLYQAAEGLITDGICGPATWRALRQEELPSSTRFPQLIHCLEGLGYLVHYDGQINICGIRSPARTAGAFDDLLCLAWVQDGQWQWRRYPATTDPGLYWLEEGRADGTAVMAPGQYVDCYGWGLHRGSYETIVQIGPVKCFRDANKDDQIDMDPSTIQIGWGLNLHRAGEDSEEVNRWSAGCQVWKRREDWREAMRICKASLADSFTYTLLTEEETRT